jgi:hypothetical protein
LLDPPCRKIKNWTFWFKVNGKPVWSTDFQTLKDDMNDLGMVPINSTTFTRK